MVHYTQVAIRSKQFGVYVQLNGAGISKLQDSREPYRGTVRTAGHAAGWEIFNLHHNNDDTVSFEASQFRNVFLCLDGNGVEPGVHTDFAGGSVAAQYGASAWEKFHIRRIDEATGTVTIESAHFPRRYLRVDGNPGVVNVQGVAAGWEQFEIVVLGYSRVWNSIN